MRNINLIFCLCFFILASCGNNPGSDAAKKSDSTAMQNPDTGKGGRTVVAGGKDTVVNWSAGDTGTLHWEAVNKSPDIDSVSLQKNFDVYKFENDTIVQMAYVHYLSHKRILFKVTSQDKRTGKQCAMHDTADITSDEDKDGPSAYSDELDEGDLYPAYEFLIDLGPNHSNHTYIGVEPSRGKRLKVHTAFSLLCGKTTPLNSVGTLRRVRLSEVKQEGPHLPPGASQ